MVYQLYQKASGPKSLLIIEGERNMHQAIRLMPKFIINKYMNLLIHIRKIYKFIRKMDVFS